MNYFEQPVAQTFMDTYAPLPFQELAMLGAVYKKEKDETEEAIDEFASKYGDFTSMSEYDVKSWDQETMGRLRPALLEMAADPEKIKSQEFQAGIRSAIRSIDTAKLSALRQNAENYKIRAANIAKLIAEGKYKESWDPINISQWRTIGPNGQINMMTDLSPIEYKSLHDIAAPYSQALEDQYLGRIDRYRYWKGVDEAQIRNALNTVSTDIFNTPQGQAWYRDISSELATRGITDPNAVREEMMNRLVQSQKDYMHRNLAYDTAAIQEDTLALKRRIAAGKEQPETPPARYTDMIRLDGKRYLNSLTKENQFVPSVDKDALYKANMDLMIANTTGNTQKISEAQENYDKAFNKANSSSFRGMIRDNFNQAIGRDFTGTTVSGEELVRGTRSVMDLLSTDNSLKGAKSILDQMATATMKENGEVIYTMKDSRALQNPTTVVASMEGLNLRRRRNKFDQMLSSGAFKNIQVEPMIEHGLFNYIDKDGNFKQKQRVYVTVREADVDKSMLSPSEKKIFYNLLKYHGASVITNEGVKLSETVTNKYTPEGKLDSKSVSTTTSGSGSAGSVGDNYITFEAFIDVPTDESGYQGTVVTDINTSYDRYSMTPSQAGKLLGQQQADAFYSGQYTEDNIDLDEILNE